MTDIEKGMIQGIALCLQIMKHVEGTLDTNAAKEIIGATGLNQDDCKRADVDNYDFQAIQKDLNEYWGRRK
jgi:hypothetical protein